MVVDAFPKQEPPVVMGLRFRGDDNNYYRGAMRMAPSSRMVSPFSIAFSTM